MLELIKSYLIAWRYYLLAFVSLSFLVVYILGIKIVLLICASTLAFLTGCVALLFQHGWERSEELIQEFESVNFNRSTGISALMTVKKVRNKAAVPRMTGSSILDPIIENIISLILRDFVDSWYQSISNDDHQLQDALRVIMHETVASISSQLGQVDWVPFLTQQLVDDFASHMRLYRMAKDKSRTKSAEDLETIFFDLELEMEKSCRDLVSTSTQYENGIIYAHCMTHIETPYLHDVTDSLLYLLLPHHDFKCRPQRFLIREVIARKVLLPFMDMICDPDYVNSTVTWLLEDVSLNSDDFISILEWSSNVEELEAMRDSLDEEMGVQRAKDTGGNFGIKRMQSLSEIKNYVRQVSQDEEIKQQLNSLQFVKNIVLGRLHRLGAQDSVDNVLICEAEEVVVPKTPRQLPIDVVLGDILSVDYFIKYVERTSGVREKTYIDLYLAIEGFKSVVDHERASVHLESVMRGDGKVDMDISGTIKETAKELFNQFLSNDCMQADFALTDVEQTVVQNIESILDSEEKIDEKCFDDVQLDIYTLLRTDNRFYPTFVKSEDYPLMLADTNLAEKASLTAEPETDSGRSSAMFTLSEDKDTSDTGSILSDDSGNVYEYGNAFCWETAITDSPLQAKICSVGVVRENNEPYGVYSVQVMKKSKEGDALWNVHRRYSEFFAFHNNIIAKFPTLGWIRFPGKKMRGNVSEHFLERRKHGLNIYMQTVLQSSILAHNEGLIEMAVQFLQQGRYVGSSGSIQNKLISMMNPIKSGVRAFGNAVISTPDMVYDGVTRVGVGVGKVTKTMINKAGSMAPSTSALNPRSVRSLPVLPNRVSDGLINQMQGAIAVDNIPMKILIRFMDDVFGLTGRNQWFRRQLVVVLKGIVSAAFGNQINKKIVDFVIWLTSENQVAQYLTAFRNSFWPNGVFADPTPERSQSILMRTRVVAKVKMMAVLPDELRLFIGAETSRSGIELIFEALQNTHLNRRLVYVILEHFLMILFPNNKMRPIFHRLHSKSPRFQSRSHD